MSCKVRYHNVKLSIGYYQLHTDMYALPLGDCDVVLGAQWLHTLGPIL